MYKGRECQGKPRRVLRTDLFEHDVDLQKISGRVHHRDQGRDGVGEPSLLAGARQQGRHCEDGEEQRGEADRHPHLGHVVEACVPADVKQQSSGVTQKQQAPPRFQDDQRERARVEEDNVGEQRHFTILAGGEQQRRGESADQGEGRQDFRVLGPGHQRGRSRHRKHHGESHAAGHQAVHLEGRVQREIKHADPDRLQRV